MKHIIRSKYPDGDILHKSFFLGSFIYSPERTRKGFDRDEVGNSVKDPLIVLGNGAVEPVVNFLDL